MFDFTATTTMSTSTCVTLQVPMPELVPISSPSPRREVSSQTPPPALLSPSPSPKTDFRRTPGKAMQGADDDMTGVSIALSVLSSIAQTSPEIVQKKKNLPLPPLLSPEQERRSERRGVDVIGLPELISADEEDESDMDADLLALPDLLTLSPQPLPTPELIPLSPDVALTRKQIISPSWVSTELSRIFATLG